MRKLAFFILTIFFLGDATAQEPKAVMSLDTNFIQTGERALLNVEFQYRVDQGDVNIVWPEMKDSLPNKMEILNVSPIDTQLVNQSEDPFLFVQRREIQITSFDTGYLAIHPILLRVNNDSILSNALLIRVEEPLVDETAEFKDIKDIESVELSFWEKLSQYKLYIVAAIALIILAVVVRKLIIAQKKKEKATEEIVEEIAPEISPYEWASSRLKTLKSEGLWQSGNYKGYYSRLNTILRGYLERRYGIHAMEETTTDIIRELERLGLDPRLKSKLRSGLMLSDLVKFAKEKPVAQENEDAYLIVKEFVEISSKEELSEA